VTAAAGPLPPGDGPPAALAPPGQRIALAQDIAFSFTYPHMLDDWRTRGAQILPFSPLADEPPDSTADAIFLPGGYPELHAGRLAATDRFRAGMAAAAARGTRIYGECGGYMVLGRGLRDAAGQRHEMLGLLPLETSFHRRKLSLGYRRLRPLPGAPWQGPLMAHEFHYATVDSPPADASLFAAEDADGAALPPMGHRAGAICGSFAHVIAPAAG
jgi:cobyrinic acid a,c-diamide synthase